VNTPEKWWQPWQGSERPVLSGKDPNNFSSSGIRFWENRSRIKNNVRKRRIM
jgi:hypothetical protein